MAGGRETGCLVKTVNDTWALDKSTPVSIMSPYSTAGTVVSSAAADVS